jgi:hypothetical protein
MIDQSKDKFKPVTYNGTIRNSLRLITSEFRCQHLIRIGASHTMIREWSASVANASLCAGVVLWAVAALPKPVVSLPIAIIYGGEIAVPIPTVDPGIVRAAGVKHLVCATLGRCISICAEVRPVLTLAGYANGSAV